MDDFSQLQLGGQPHERWAQDFAAAQQDGRSQSWNQIWDESNEQHNKWANEFGQSQAATVWFLDRHSATIFSKSS